VDAIAPDTAGCTRLWLLGVYDVRILRRIEAQSLLSP
jgi:hypothetical protein